MSPTATGWLAGLLAVVVASRWRVRPRPRRVGGGDTGPAGRDDRAVPVRRRGRPVAPPEQVAAWCDALARAVGSGSTLSAALREVEPPSSCADTIGRIRLALARGTSLHAALSCPAGSPHLDVALTVLRTCAAHGGDAAQPLGRTAVVLRERAAAAAELHTQSAQARLSATVMTALPVGMLALLTATSAPVRGFVASPAGLATVAAGLTLNVAGRRWMTRLIGGGRR
ncbi:MAG TPA: type II secretion system F family protein [Ilumatobacter sp.]